MNLTLLNGKPNNDGDYMILTTNYDQTYKSGEQQEELEGVRSYIDNAASKLERKFLNKQMIELENLIFSYNVYMKCTIDFTPEMEKQVEKIDQEIHEIADELLRSVPIEYLEKNNFV